MVFLAFDPVLQRDVALKIPRPEAVLTESLRQRFLAERKAATQSAAKADDATLPTPELSQPDHQTLAQSATSI